MTISSICASVAAAAGLVGGTTAPAAAETTAPAATNPYCDVAVALVSQWSTGYGATFAIRNISTTSVRWRLVIKFRVSPWSLQVWNATATQEGTTATITPYPPSGTLQPRQTVTAGMYYASGSINTAPPLAEVTCTPIQ